MLHPEIREVRSNKTESGGGVREVPKITGAVGSPRVPKISIPRQTRLERVVGGFDNFGCCWVSKGTKNLLFSSKSRGTFRDVLGGKFGDSGGGSEMSLFASNVHKLLTSLNQGAGKGKCGYFCFKMLDMLPLLRMQWGICISY